MTTKTAKTHKTADRSARILTTTRRGDIQHWRRTLIPTTREAPADAELPSHVLLTRAGFIRRVGAGIYDYLPLAWRSLEKISAIVREEMNAAGASEMLMPALEPIELFRDTRRDVDYGDLLFKVTDRHGRVEALAPTHEEVITELMMSAITSYKQLPLNLYQIQTKYRDEFRPRAGLLRCREFIMKDAYSFSLTVDGPGGLNEMYDAMYEAYVNIFTRCGLDFTVVEAEAGPIGGSASHEFMVNAESGEDRILRCPESGYAANVEKCEIGPRDWAFDGAPVGDLEKVHTPKMPGIDEVVGALGVTPAQMLKTVVFQVTGQITGQLIGQGGQQGGDAPKWVLAVVRGDHDVNEGKVRDAAGLTIELAAEKPAKEAGFKIGYVSPLAAKTIPGCLILVDPDAARGTVDWATGADEYDHHVKHFNWIRDAGDLHLPGVTDEIGSAPSYVKVADIRSAVAGDPSPKAKGGVLIEQRGIEVGHIFKLGTKYSEAMGFTVLSEQQKKTAVIMGCYGIGVSRTLAACVEMSHDEAGIIFPPAIAPYHVLITLMKPDEAEHADLASRLAGELADAGVDVLIDDRPERPGVKFNDADLIGIPVRLTIGQKSLDAGGVEFKLRRDAGKGEVVGLEEVVERVVAGVEGW